ncbi:MAG: hypothetical protein ACREUU_05640, partial [Gammaproteobacteria bacterium]
DVVLVMTIRGVPDREWSAGEIYLTSGRDRINVTRRVRLSGLEDRVAVFVVPLSMTKFALHIGGQVSVPSEAMDAIVDHIMMR